MLDIEKWLASHGLGHLAALILENEIDEEVLPHLTDEDLKDLGLPLGARVKLRRAIEQLKAGGSPPPEPEAGPQDGPEMPSSEAERRHLTVMFVDLVKSTELAARLDPEDMRDVITAYQNTVAGVVSRLRGHVAKFMGDGVLCYFGWPRAGEDDPERATRAGLEIVGKVGAVSAPDGEKLAVRIGISTGLVVVGDLVGEGAAQEQAVVGETPNLAARLQAVARPNAVVVSAATHQLLSGMFQTSPLGVVDLKGITEPAAAFLVEAERPTETRFEARLGGEIPPMVGREHELGLVIERWERACAGEGQLVLVTGEAGIGKSRLTSSVVEAVADAPHFRVNYQCSPYHSDSSFYPVTQQLTFSAGLRPADSAGQKLDKLEATLHAADRRIIASLLGIDASGRYEPLSLTPQQLRQRTLSTLAEELVALSRLKPVLLVIEDAHWIDASTLELIDYCLDKVSGARVLLLVTARPTFEHGFGGHPIVSRLALNRLGIDQIRGIISRVTRGKAMPPNLVSEIVARTDGIPLFVEELTKSIIESGILSETETAYELVRPLSHVSIPATLHDSLMARIDRLQPVKEVAQMAACIGREFDHALLASVSGHDDARLRNALGQLIGAELVFRRGSGETTSYVFKHALVRDVAYQSLLRSRRQEIHSRILDILEADPATAPELAAHHATEAGQLERAIPLWGKAGEDAAARPAYEEAVNHLQFAIALVEKVEDRSAWHLRELSLLIQLAQVFIAKIGYASVEASEAFARAANMLNGSESPNLRVATLYGTWIGPYIGGDQLRGIEIATRLVDDVDAQDEPLPRLIAHRMRAATLIAMGRPEEALSDLAISRGIFGDLEIGDFASRFAQDPGVQISCYELLALWLSGRQDEAFETATRAISRARELNHANTFCYAALHYVTLAIWAGEPDLANPVNDDLARLAEEHDMTLWKIYGNLHAGVLRCQAGEPDAADALTDVLSNYLDQRCALWLTLYLAEQAKAYLRLGRLDDAEASIARAVETMERNGERCAEAELIRVRGRIRAARGAPAEAETAFRDAVRIADSQRSRTLALRAAVDLARSLADRGRHGEALAALKPVAAFFPAASEARELLAARRVVQDLDR